MHLIKHKIDQKEFYSFKKYLRQVLTLLLLTTLFCSAKTVRSQDSIISRDASDYPLLTVIDELCGPAADETCITLPDIDPALGYTFAVPLDLTSYPGSQVTLITVDNCVEPSIVINNSAGTIEFPADGSICNGDYIEFKARASYEEPPFTTLNDSVNFKIRYERKPIKIAFVLDISGSMYSPVYNGISYGDSRWQVLKNSVSAFLTKFELVDGNNDLVGLTYFTTDVVPSDIPLGDNLIPSVGSEAIVFADMAPRNPLNLTAMGLGLKKAKDDLLSGNTNDGYKKIILLFTDGMQNVDPLAHTEEVSPGIYATYIGPEVENYRLNDESITEPDSIFYYSIAMNTGTGIPLLLKDLAEKNGGNAYFTSFGVYGTCDPPDATQDCDLMTDFDEALQKILYGSSPQLVSRNISSLSNGEQNFTFEINDYISNIIFEIDYKKGDQINFSKIIKGDYDLTNYFDYKYSKDSVFLIASLKLPLKWEKDYISSKGTWNVTVSGTSENNFAFKCFVDDHYFKFNCSTGKDVYTVGDTLEFSTNLSFAGNPITNNDDKVSLILLKPGDDIGHLLATYDTPDSQPDSIDPASDASQKLYDLLLNDSSFYQSLKANDLLIELESDGNGNFKNIYTNTELTGVYQAYFIIDADHPEFGKFNRIQKQSLVLKFGQLDPEETETDIKVTPGDKGQTFVVTLKPKNKFGYYLGPGFMSYIKLNADSLSGHIISKKDHLDGSYTFTIASIPNDKTKEDLQVNIMGQDLFSDDACYQVTKWYYIILIIIILILVSIKKYKSKLLNFILWLILVVWVLYIILRYLEIICYKFL